MRRAAALQDESDCQPGRRLEPFAAYRKRSDGLSLIETCLSSGPFEIDLNTQLAVSVSAINFGGSFKHFTPV